VKFRLLLWLIWLISNDLLSLERGPAVMVGLVNGKEIRFRLDHIDENKVVGIKPGPERYVFSRSEISWMRFRPEVPKKIPAGTEGVLLSDGKILPGSPVWVDEKYFWIEDQDLKRQRIEIKKVVFIQLANSKDAIRIPSVSENAITSQVRVDAARNWTLSNLMVRPGQQIWFTVGDDPLSCSSQSVTADGVLNSTDTNLPIPASNVCSLIGKIGEHGKPFPIGLKRTPFIPETSGQLFLGVNDKSFEDNNGHFDVFVKIERSEAPEGKNGSNP
jgi:hypothetical protein